MQAIEHALNVEEVKRRLREDIAAIEKAEITENETVNQEKQENKNNNIIYYESKRCFIVYFNNGGVFF